MKLWKKGLAGFIGAALLTVLLQWVLHLQQRAAPRSPVSALPSIPILRVGDSGGSVTASANGSNYDVTDVDIVNDDGEWVDGDVPRVEITLEADSDYYFTPWLRPRLP